MTQYVATRWHEGIAYGEIVEAESWDLAKAICDSKGWRLDGQLMAVLKAKSVQQKAVQDICDAMNERHAATVH